MNEQNEKRELIAIILGEYALKLWKEEDYHGITNQAIDGIMDMMPESGLISAKVDLGDNSYLHYPMLTNGDDIFYTGIGCSWGIDDNGNRFWKRFHPKITNTFGEKFYNDLDEGDIIDNEERERVAEMFKSNEKEDHGRTKK